MNDNNGFNLDNNFNAGGQVNNINNEPITYDSYYNPKPRKKSYLPVIIVIIVGIIFFAYLWLNGVLTPMDRQAEYNKLYTRVCNAAVSYANNKYSEYADTTGKILYVTVGTLANENLIEANLRNYLTDEEIAADTGIRLEVLPSKTFQCHGFVYKGDDKIKPVITLKGASVITSGVGVAVTDPGATALDDKDGDISEKIDRSGNVNINNAGTYKVSYIVSDRSGNLSDIVERTYVIQ